MAAASPALWFVALHGQVSVLALAALAWPGSALRHATAVAGRLRAGCAGVQTVAVRPGARADPRRPGMADIDGRLEPGRSSSSLASLCRWVGTDSESAGRVLHPRGARRARSGCHAIRRRCTRYGRCGQGSCRPPIATVAYAACAFVVVGIGAAAWHRCSSAGPHRAHVGRHGPGESAPVRVRPGDPDATGDRVGEQGGGDRHDRMASQTQLIWLFSRPSGACRLS